MPLDALLSGESAILYLQARTADAVLSELATALAQQSGLPMPTIEAGLREREALGSTAMGHGLALPHARAEIQNPCAVLGIAADGIEFAAPDEQLVRVFVAFVSPLVPAEHLRALSDVCRSFSPPLTVERIIAAERPEQVLAVLRGAA